MIAMLFISFLKELNLMEMLEWTRDLSLRDCNLAFSECTVGTILRNIVYSIDLLPFVYLKMT